MLRKRMTAKVAGIGQRARDALLGGPIGSFNEGFEGDSDRVERRAPPSPPSRATCNSITAATLGRAVPAKDPFESPPLAPVTPKTSVPAQPTVLPSPRAPHPRLSPKQPRCLPLSWSARQASKPGCPNQQSRDTAIQTACPLHFWSVKPRVAQTPTAAAPPAAACP